MNKKLMALLLAVAVPAVAMADGDVKFRDARRAMLQAEQDIKNAPIAARNILFEAHKKAVTDKKGDDEIAAAKNALAAADKTITKAELKKLVEEAAKKADSDYAKAKKAYEDRGKFKNFMGRTGDALDWTFHKNGVIVIPAAVVAGVAIDIIRRTCADAELVKKVALACIGIGQNKAQTLKENWVLALEIYAGSLAAIGLTVATIIRLVQKFRKENKLPFWRGIYDIKKTEVAKK